ncbi:varicose-related protein [Lactuca sativa]|uniref:varicose-related protein n=1 Tax=Lactuca sativa TaxID=4236 RepID=UPI001C68E0BC|nr:varicose-related protein [Lactuca sativa]
MTHELINKVVNQLEKTVNTMLEATVSRQIQVQLQTSGKQALQEALKSSMEASVLPAFEMSCKTMFDQIDSTFQKGMVDHTTAAHQQVESIHSPLAFALRDTINSASSITQTLTSELTDGQRKFVALAGSKSVNPLLSQTSNGPTSGFHEKVFFLPCQNVAQGVDLLHFSSQLSITLGLMNIVIID